MKNNILFTLVLYSCCMLIVASNDDSGFDVSPCQTSLGLRHGMPPGPLEFHVTTSTGDSDDVRLNSPIGWSPAGQLEDHFIQIRTATPVLVTGILLQGGVGGQGRITSGSIHASLDCAAYTTQNFSITDKPNPEAIVPIRLSTLAFVRCIRLVPNGSLGQTPGLRLDLLGCVIGKQSPCRISSNEDTEGTSRGSPGTPDVLYQITNPPVNSWNDDNHPAATSTINTVDFQTQTTPEADGNTKTNVNNDNNNNNNREEHNNSDQSSSFKNIFKPDKTRKESAEILSKTLVVSEGDFNQSKTLPTTVSNQVYATPLQPSDLFEKEEEAKPGNATSISHVSSDPSNSNEKSNNNEDIKMKNESAVLYNEQFVDASVAESIVERKKENLTEIMKNIRINKLGCGTKSWPNPHSRHKRVVRGRQSSPNEWPWLVSLHFLPETNFTERSGFKHFCGASLIAPDWLISAAHCFSRFVNPGLTNLSEWEVYISLHDQASKDGKDVQTRNITMVIEHAGYDIVNNSFKADVSLIKLDRPVSWSSSASAICVDDTNLFYQEALCYVTGWGQRNYLNSKGTQFPYMAPLSILTLAECKTRYDTLVNAEHEFSSLVYVDDPVICAYGQAGEDSCQGDSGGPLMCMVDDKWVLAGIVSGGYDCGVELFPGFYTRVSYYYDWIVRQMALYGD